MTDRPTIKVSTLRSRGFRIVKLTGCTTMISHDKPFTIDGRFHAQKRNDYTSTICGHFDKEIPRVIELDS